MLPEVIITYCYLCVCSLLHPSGNSHVKVVYNTKICTHLLHNGAWKRSVPSIKPPQKPTPIIIIMIIIKKQSKYGFFYN